MDSLGIMGSVAVDFDIENMAAACELVIGALDTGLVGRGTVVIHRYMVGVGVICLVGNAGYYAEAVAVFNGKLAREPLGGGGKDREIMAVAF